MRVPHSVQGVSAPTPRLTRSAALLLSVILSIPAFVVLTLLEWWLF